MLGSLGPLVESGVRQEEMGAGKWLWLTQEGRKEAGKAGF